MFLIWITLKYFSRPPETELTMTRLKTYIFPDSFFVTISLDMASCIMEQRLVADGEAGADAEKN